MILFETGCCVKPSNFRERCQTNHPTVFHFKVIYLFQLFGHTKVSVLNGGLHKWLAEGFQTTADVTQVEVGHKMHNLKS